MDGSFLSDERVVAASRDFVCIRLATYEDKAESTFLAHLFRGRSGELENTVFAILAPDGKTRLTRTGRSPHFAFSDAKEMAEFMIQTAARYPRRQWQTPEPLPTMNGLDVALNVAACDGLQLVVTVSAHHEELQELNARVAECAWQSEIAGQFVYASAGPAELTPVSGVSIKEGVLVVAPDDFGISGEAIAQMDASASQSSIETALRSALSSRVLLTRNYPQHIQTGVQMGIDWKTEVPVTDQQANWAKSRYRGTKEE